MTADYVWLVDPIDGTKSFVREYPMFSTQIALLHEGRLVLGVSSAPVYGELCWAERGSGAWLNGDRLTVSKVETIEAATLSAGNLPTLARSSAWGRYGLLVASVNRARGYGDFLQYHLLAACKIDAVIESDVNILDIAALVVILEEAGGQFPTLQGTRSGSTRRVCSPRTAGCTDRSSTCCSTVSQGRGTWYPGYQVPLSRSRPRDGRSSRVPPGTCPRY